MRQLNCSFKWIFLLIAASLLGAESDCCPPPGARCERFKDERARLFPSVPCEPCGYYFVFDVTALAWQAREEGLNFALKNEPIDIQAAINVNGEMVGIDFDWEPAVKVRLAALFAERAWDFALKWTYFHTNTSKVITTGLTTTGAGLLPIWAFPTANIAQPFVYGSSKAKWDLNLHEVDIELGYEPFLSPYISLRWLSGLKILSIDQDFNVRYQTGLVFDNVQLGSAGADLTNKMTGTGPRIGFDTKWRLTQGFSLAMNIAGSLPLWHYRVTRRDLASAVLNNADATIDAQSRERFWVFRPVLETLLGVNWETCLGCRCQYPFGLGVNYEFQYFSEVNMFHKLVNPSLVSLSFFPRGDLHLHGVSFNLHFGF